MKIEAGTREESFQKEKKTWKQHKRKLPRAKNNYFSEENKEQKRIRANDNKEE